MPSDTNTPTPTLNPPTVFAPACSTDPALLSAARLTVEVDTDRLTLHPVELPAGSVYSQHREPWYVLVARWDAETCRHHPLDVNNGTQPSFVRLDVAATTSALDALREAIDDGSGTVKLGASAFNDCSPWVVYTVHHTPDDEADDDEGCPGHEPDPAANGPAGVSVYCDGSCQ